MSETEPAPEVRIDKWLWAVRVYKTRSLATQACRAGNVKIGSQRVKPSHTVKLDEVIIAKTDGMHKTVKVIGLLENRVSAKLAPQFAQDLTPASEYEKKAERQFVPGAIRARGTGRPTKKERRDIERFRDHGS